MNGKGTGVLIDTIALRIKKLKDFWAESSIHKQLPESKHRGPHAGDEEDRLRLGRLGKKKSKEKELG